MSVVPLPVLEPVRRLLVPAWVLVAALIAALVLGSLMFALGRAARPTSTISDESAAPLAALVRIDRALIARDPALARTLLVQATLPSGTAVDAALELRQKALATLERELAASAAHAAPDAVVKRLDARLQRIDEAGITLGAPVPPSPEPVTVVTGAPSSSVALEPVKIVHPADPRRVYSLQPGKGLLRSDDGGETWRPGIGRLPTMVGTKLAFSAGDQPLLLIMGTELWVFSDDEPGFFPR